MIENSVPSKVLGLGLVLADSLKALSVGLLRLAGGTERTGHGGLQESQGHDYNQSFTSSLPSPSPIIALSTVFPHQRPQGNTAES